MSTSNPDTPEIWSTIPRSQTRVFNTRVSADGSGHPAILHHAHNHTATSPLSPSRQPPQGRVPSQYIAEAPGSSAFQTGPATVPRKTSLCGVSYAHVSSQQRLADVDETPGASDEYHLDGYVYGQIFSNLAGILKVDGELEGSPVGSTLLGQSSPAQDINRAVPGQSHLAELARDPAERRDNMDPTSSNRQYSPSFEGHHTQAAQPSSQHMHVHHSPPLVQTRGHMSSTQQPPHGAVEPTSPRPAQRYTWEPAVFQNAPSTEMQAMRIPYNMANHSSPAAARAGRMSRAWRRTKSVFTFGKGKDGKTKAPIRSQAEIFQRCQDFAESHRIPQTAGVDLLSSILMYLPNQLRQREAEITAQSLEIRKLRETLQTEIRKLRETMQTEINNLTKRRDKYRTDAEKAQHQLELMTQHRDRVRQDLEATKAEFQSSQQLVGEFQASFNQQIEYNEQFKTRLRALEGENERIFKVGEQKIQELQASRSSIMVEKDRQFGEMEAALKEEIVTLKTRIAAYGVGNFRMVSDEAFQAKLQALAQRISNLVSHVPRPDASNLDPTLDPTHFLSRNEKYLGNRIWPKFIRAVCWGVLTRGFFGYPLGFGIFGTQGGGYSVLCHVYESFAVFDPTAKRVILPNNKETNEARGFLFERIWTDVTSGPSRNAVNGKGSAAHVKGFTSFFHQQVERVTAELISNLTRCSANSLDAQAPSTIRDVVYDMALLALEMATQRSHVTLQFCGYGEMIQAGDLFRDENDSDSNGEGMVRVDLMTEPGLLRLGNGREDLTSRRVLGKGGFIVLKN